MFSKPERVIDKAYLAWVREMSCLACNKYPSEPHHLQSRGAGGGDDHWNVIPTCREHHTEVHLKGLVYLANRYVHVKNFLIKNGWELNDNKEKYIHTETQNLDRR